MSIEDQRNRGTEKQWEQRTSGYRGPVGTEDQRNSGNRGPVGTEDQWVHHPVIANFFLLQEKK